MKAANSPPPKFEDDALITGATDSQLRSVATLAERLQKALATEADLEARLKIAKEQRRALEELELPEAMDGCGMKSFKLRDGSEVTIESIVAGSITKVNEEEAFDWLRAHGHGGLIKTNVSVQLAKGQEKLRDEVLKKLRAIKGIEVTEKESVHPQTLGAWARELVRQGLSFPKDLLGIYMARKAKIMVKK